MRWVRCGSLLLPALLLLVHASPAQEARPASEVAEEMARLAERDRLWQESQDLRARGSVDEAIRVAEKVLDIDQGLFGMHDERVSATLEWLAELEEGRGDYNAAQRHLEAALEAKTILHGARHWRVTDSRIALENLERRSRMTPAQRELLLATDALGPKAVELHQAGKTRQAIELMERVAEIWKELLPEDHPAYATTLYHLAVFHSELVEYSMAESLYRQALESLRKVLGEEHPFTAAALNGLASLLVLKGEFAAALPLNLQAIEIYRRVLGEENVDFATCLHNLGLLYSTMGDYARAEPIFRQALDVCRRVCGEDHALTAALLGSLAELYRSRGEYAAAEPLHREALDVHRVVFGEEHPFYATSLNDLAALYVSMGKYSMAEPLLRKALEIYRKVLGEKHPDYATALTNLADVRGNLGGYEEAEKLYCQALQICRNVLGEEHPRYATILNNLGRLHRSRGAFGKAEPLFRQALQINRHALGENHPAVALCLQNLAALCGSLGEFAEAESLVRQALDIYELSIGKEHPDYANSLNTLAWLCWTNGRLAAAEPLFRQSLEINRKVLGESHPALAQGLHNLGATYEAMGELAVAESLYRQALEKYGRALGEDHPDCAPTLNNLSLLCGARGDFASAERLCRRALAILGRACGEEHPGYAVSLGSLASLKKLEGEYEQAEQLFREALAIQKRLLGEDHPAYATTLGCLAEVCWLLGEYVEAEQLYRRALEIDGEVLGEESLPYAVDMNNLALLFFSQGDLAAARPLLLKALSIRRSVLDSSFAVQSERQQLLMTRYFRRSLDSFLSLSAAAVVSARGAYAQVLPWKGAVFARRFLGRIRRENPELESLCDRLESTGRRLATLCLSTPPPEQQAARLRQIRELGIEKEELEREVSRKSEAFCEARAAESPAPNVVQRAIPPGAVLADFLEYPQGVPLAGEYGPGWRTERHLVAFLVPHEGEIRLVDLGSVTPIREAVSAWRASVHGCDTEETGRKLREFLWEPLAEQLGGAKLLLVSPDSIVNLLPLPGLPGSKRGTYLVEEVSIAVVPVPRMLPELLSRHLDAAEPESLVLVGDVDYGGSPGECRDPLASRSAAGAVTGMLPEFGKLAATRAEIDGIRDLFETRFEGGLVRPLLGAAATEAAFRKMAARSRWLHLATHGYFAPPSLKSALEDAGEDLFGEVKVVGYHPGLLSGLAFSGANTPTGPDGDDGILTALEVTSLDLSGVELAVLSACETGLGEVAGGEGVLGLQRAFQLAGARTTITSLWSVPDRATRMLMERFYSNLWNKGMPKLEALREAQIWLMKEGCRQGSDVARGLGIEKDELKATSGRLPPYYWAGWVLSGDWR